MSYDELGIWSFIYNYFSLTFSCESVVTLTNDLYHVNQHNITHIMQKKFFFQKSIFREKFFFRPYTSFRPHNFRYEHGNFFKMLFSCSTHQELLEYVPCSFFQKSWVCHVGRHPSFPRLSYEDEDM